MSFGEDVLNLNEIEVHACASVFVDGLGADAKHSRHHWRSLQSQMSTKTLAVGLVSCVRSGVQWAVGATVVAVIVDFGSVVAVVVVVVVVVAVVVVGVGEFGVDDDDVRSCGWSWRPMCSSSIRSVTRGSGQLERIPIIYLKFIIYILI
jgi:hypothetical protein